MVQKRVPGTGWSYIIYDNRNRVVMTQDSVQRVNNQWLTTKYDTLNRPIMTAIYSPGSTISFSSMVSMISTSKFNESYLGASAASNHGYSANVFPKTNLTILTVAYYDSYNFVNDLSLGAAYSYNHSDITGQETVNMQRVIGHPTGGKVNVLGTTNYLKHVEYYDAKYRTIQIISDNNKGGWDRTSNVVDFVGRVINTKTTHHTSTHPVDQAVAYRFTYDHMSRKLKTYLNLNNEPNEMLLSQNVYNEISQLVQKNLHLLYDTKDGQTGTVTADNLVATTYNGESNLIARNSVKLEPNYIITASSTPYRAGITTVTAAQAEATGKYFQNVDYRYNIRGWMQSMNNSQLSNDGGVTNSDATDLFGFELAYNTPFTTGTSTGNVIQYNGNISAMKWSSNLGAGAVKDVAYNYTYDPLNRIMSASYWSDNAGAWTNTTGAFSESGYQYDQNGNIKNLIRNGSSGSAMDNMTYTYNGNQLLTVTDAGDVTKGFIDGNTSGSDYAYDVNGNMVTDKNKSLTASNAILYNHLNLPTQVTKSTSEKIVYTYNAAGIKLTQQVYNSSGAVTKTMEYDGPFIYQGDTLQFINHEEGRIVMKNNPTPEYQYHLKDHLGNVRVTFTTETTTKTFTAGFETTKQTAETSNFSNYPSASHINTVATNAHSGTNSLYLNGSANGGQVGVTKSFSVMPGDVVTIQAYSKYNTPTNTPSNLAGFATALLGAFNMTTPAPGETGTARAALNSWGAGEAAAFGDGTTDNTDLKVFVTILMFDRNYVFLDVAYQQLTSSGVMNVSYKAKQAGYAYIYISNEQSVLTDVYFDDITVTFTPTPVIQQEDFYPFGLSFNSYQRENSVSNQYLFNQGTGDKTFKTERVYDLELNVDESKYRTLDYITGRWWQIDPKADEGDLVDLTPYNYSYNDPIRLNDPEGDCPFCPAIPWIVAIAEAAAPVVEAAIVAGSTMVAVELAKHVDASSPGTAYSPAVGFAMSTTTPGQLTSPNLLNSESKNKPDQGAMQRGRDNEKKALKDEGLNKNNKTKTTIDPKTGKEVNVKPDGENETTIGEVKDTKTVSNTKQIRGEREVAKQAGKDFKIITGDKTKVSKNIPAKEVVRKPYLGPQPK
jgi:hypothetical protein